MPIINEEKQALERQIRDKFGGAELLKIKDAMELVGVTDYRAIHRIFKFKKGYISVSNAAKAILEFGK